MIMPQDENENPIVGADITIPVILFGVKKE